MGKRTTSNEKDRYRLGAFLITIAIMFYLARETMKVEPPSFGNSDNGGKILFIFLALIIPLVLTLVSREGKSTLEKRSSMPKIIHCTIAILCFISLFFVGLYVSFMIITGYIFLSGVAWIAYPIIKKVRKAIRLRKQNRMTINNQTDPISAN
jgi:chromate transport protein ChrA